MNIALQSTDAQWVEYFARIADKYRAEAEVCRADARAELAKPFGVPNQARVDELLARADRYEAMAREQTEGEA